MLTWPLGRNRDRDRFAHWPPRISSIGVLTILWSGQSLWITTITSSSHPRSAVRNPAFILLSKRHRHPWAWAPGVPGRTTGLRNTTVTCCGLPAAHISSSTALGPPRESSRKYQSRRLPCQVMEDLTELADLVTGFAGWNHLTIVPAAPPSMTPGRRSASARPCLTCRGSWNRPASSAARELYLHAAPFDPAAVDGDQPEDPPAHLLRHTAPGPADRANSCLTVQNGAGTCCPTTSAPAIFYDLHHIITSGFLALIRPGDELPDSWHLATASQTGQPGRPTQPPAARAHG